MFDFKFDFRVAVKPTRTKKEIVAEAARKRAETAARKAASKDRYHIPANAPTWSQATPLVIIESIVCGCCGESSRSATMFYKSHLLRDASTVRLQRADVAQKSFDATVAEVQYATPIHAPFCADCIEAALAEQPCDGKYRHDRLPSKQLELFPPSAFH